MTESGGQPCFHCGRMVDASSAERGPLRYCTSCRSDLDAYLSARERFEDEHFIPSYQGTIAVGRHLDGWPTELVLVTLEVWDSVIELHFLERPGTDPPALHPLLQYTTLGLGDQPPRKWTATTDVGTTHHGAIAGGGTPGTDEFLAWVAQLAPTLPTSATSLTVTAQSPASTANLDVSLDAWSPSIRRDSYTGGLTAGRPDCPSCGLPPEALIPERSSEIDLPWAIPKPPPLPTGKLDHRLPCRQCEATAVAVFDAKRTPTAMPERVVALGVDLGEAFGSRPIVSSLIAWPKWFDVTIVGPDMGTWGEAHGSRRASTWAAEDDCGHHYVGSRWGGLSGEGLAEYGLSFIPALDQRASALTLIMPVSFDGISRRATFALPSES